MEKELSKESEKKVASFSIPKYILNVILPKCTIVYSEAVPSTYFQIALTINNSTTAKGWQKNKSWISLHTISKITGFNFRTVNIAVDVLKQINLLEQTKHGKLKMFQLKNNKIESVEEMVKLNNFVEYHLLSNAPSKKRDSIKQKFDELNKKLNIYSPFHGKILLKNVWIPGVQDIRKALIKAESIYKGSSLFFMSLMNQQTDSKKDDIILSQRDQGLLIGCSQSTLNRYIVAYKKENFLKKKNNLYYLDLDEDNNEIKKDESAVENIMEEKKLICPICQREMKNVRSFNLHLSKIQDAQHYTLNELRKEKRTPDYEVTLMLYSQNIDTIKSLAGVSKEEVKVLSERNKVTSEFKNEEVQPQLKGKETEFKDLPSIKKVSSEDTAPGLLKFFYELNGQKSPNWGKECKQIKNLLTHKEQPSTPDEIRIALKFMARKGYTDIRFLNTSINEAILENKLLEDIEKEGTASSLVKRFYNGFNMDINLQTFVRDVRKIQETMNSGLDYEQTKIVIDYMIETNCNVLNFIGSKRNDALSKYSNKNVNLSHKGINNFNNNPSFFDQDFLNILKDELAGGRTRLNKVEEKYQEEAEKIAKELFMKKKFSNKFTGFEWVWRIGLSLDKKMYDLACRELGKKTYLENALASGKLRLEQETAYTTLKSKYEIWLQKQHDFFRSQEMMSNQN